MSEKEHKQIIERNVPLLVKLLLNSQEEDEEYEACRQFAFTKLRHHGYPSLNVNLVYRNLRHFMDRYHIECMSEFGNTFYQLCDCIMKNPLWLRHSQPELGWSLINFMLSANYDTFRNVRRFRREMEAQRKDILAAVEYTYQLDSKERSESVNEINWLANINGSPIKLLKLSPEIKAKLEEQTAGLPLLFKVPQMFALAAAKAKLKKESLLLENAAAAVVARAGKIAVALPKSKSLCSLEMFLSKIDTTELKGNELSPLVVEHDKSKESCCALKHERCEIHLAAQPQEAAKPKEQRFEIVFAEHMRQQLGNMSMPMPEMTAECRMLRELIIMYFCPGDSYYFQLMEHGIRVRKKKSPTCTLSQLVMRMLESQVMPTLQDMLALRLFIDASMKALLNVDTLTCMCKIIECLLRPVVEHLIDYEHQLTTDGDYSNLEAFLRYMKPSLERVTCLCSIAHSSYVWTLPAETQPMPHTRTLFSIANLQLQIRAHAGFERACAATVLLHLLKPYCDYLDKWWQNGNFNDGYAEFLAYRTLINGLTMFDLRPLEKLNTRELQSPLYDVMAEHVKAAGPSIALLVDTLRLRELALSHDAMFKKTLHVSFMEGVLQQLLPYQVNPYGFSSLQSDTQQRIQRLGDPKLRELFQNYLWHTAPDSALPAGCSLEHLLYCFEDACCYAPLDQLIVNELQRLLTQRTVLVNAFVMHLMMGKFQLASHLNFVRSTFLLQNFSMNFNCCKLFYLFLEKRLFLKAAMHMEHLICCSNRKLGLLFSVQLPKTMKMKHSAVNVPLVLDQITLNYICNAALARIISDAQLKQYNDTFRLLLKAQWAAWKLMHFSPMPEGTYMLHEHTKNAINCLRNTKFKLMSAINGLQVYPFKSTATNMDSPNLNLFQYNNLQQLQQAHAEFLNNLSRNWQICSLRLGLDNGLQEMFSLVHLLEQLWLRLRRILKNEMDVLPSAHESTIQLAYDKVLITYFKCFNNVSNALQSMLYS